MIPLRLVGLLLSDVAKDIFRHRGQHLLAVLTLASGLLLAGGGLLLVESLDRWVLRMEAMAKITVFAAESASLDETEVRLKHDPRFSEVRRVSSHEATQRFLETTREAGMLLDSLGREALPESLELSIRPDLLTSRKAIEVGESLKALPGVGDVVVDQARLEALQHTARLARSALSTLGLLLLVAAGFSTGNVIRMSIMAREEEITIMRLVGATEAFIRTPLILEGAFLGLAASSASILTLFALWWPLNKGLGGFSPLLVQLARLGFFSPRSLLLLGFLGALTGALGAMWGFWSTQRIQRNLEALAANNAG
jgi:cell division transport system permease protein